MAAISRSGNCAVCGDRFECDEKTAGVLGSRLLCEDCTDEPVLFQSQCLDCEWDYQCEDREANRHHARVRVQQEGNSHESRMSLDGENHETVWREIDRSEVSGEGIDHLDDRTPLAYAYDGLELVAILYTEEAVRECRDSSWLTVSRTPKGEEVRA